MDNGQSHAGTFTAADGHWSLQATNGWHDEGTYTFQSPDVWVVTGKLGTGTWRRAANSPQARQRRPGALCQRAYHRALG